MLDSSDGELAADDGPPINRLPDELLLRILMDIGRAHATSLGAACRCCVSWHNAASADSLWRALALERWDWLTRRPPTGVTWREYHGRLTRSESASFVVLGTPGKGRSFSLGAQAWEDTPQGLVERNSAALVRDDDGALYAIGGRGERALSSVERLRPASAAAWECMPPMATARTCPAAALASSGGASALLVTGGGESVYRHSKVYASCELLRLAPQSDAAPCESACDGGGDGGGGWRPFPSLRTPRCAHSLAVSPADVAYAVGGYGGGVAYLDTIEAVDLQCASRGWSVVARLPAARAFAVGALGPDKGLYVLGGFDRDASSLASCLRWDPRSGKAESIAPMATARAYFAGAFAPDGQLSVGGGFEWSGQLSSAEAYDPRADRWRPLPDFGAHIEFCTGVCAW